MIFLNNPIAHNKFPKPKIFKAKMQNTQKKSESNFFDNAHLHTTPKLGGVIAQKRYQKSASRQHLHCKATLRSRASTLR